MSGSDSAGVNAMVPGRKCEPDSSAFTCYGGISLEAGVSTSPRCIVGILRVRDFSTATEVGNLLGRSSVDPSAWNRGSGCDSFVVPHASRYHVDSWSCLSHLCDLFKLFFKVSDALPNSVLHFPLIVLTHLNLLSNLSHFLFKQSLHLCPYFSTFSEATMQS